MDAHRPLRAPARRSSPRSILLLLLLLLLLPGRLTLAAGEGGSRDTERHVTLGEAFPAWEQGTLAASAVAATGLLAAGWLWGDRLEPSIGPPGADSLDRQISERFAGHQDDPLLWGVPDKGAFLFVTLPLLLYGSSTLAMAWRGEGFLGSHDVNPHLRLMASSEALVATLLVNQAVKLGVGRGRPRNVLYDVPTTGDTESKLSFFSMHTALSFTAASFLTLDLGSSMPLSGQISLGCALAGIAGLVGFSRIYDQAHFFSDVLVGAAVGALSGSAFYLLHFTLDGRPRRRGGDDPEEEAQGRALLASPSLPTSPRALQTGRGELVFGYTGRF